MGFPAAPETLLQPCEVHDVREYITPDNPFSNAKEQLPPITAWGIANTGALGDCNRDKLDLRIWFNKQKEIFERKR